MCFFFLKKKRELERERSVGLGWFFLWVLLWVLAGRRAVGRSDGGWSMEEVVEWAVFVEVDGCGLLVGELAGKTKKQEERGLLVLGCGGWSVEEVVEWCWSVLFFFPSGSSSLLFSFSGFMAVGFFCLSLCVKNGSGQGHGECLAGAWRHGSGMVVGARW